MNVKVLRRCLLFWCLFIGLGAVGGAMGMFVDLSGHWMGMDALLPYFQVLPFASVLFQDFLFPGISLLIVNGLSNLLAAVLLLRRKPLGSKLGTIFGFTLMLWITIQFIIFPPNTLSTSYFVFGVLQCLTGHLLMIAEKQAAFTFDASDYPRVGTDGQTLVVYFSRRGYCRKVAYETADALGADITEITTPEMIRGTGGFLWCGRFGMHGWPMPINELSVDPSSYKRVVLVTPIWVFSVCGPMRQFCKEQRGRIAHVSYVVCHFRGAQSISKAVATMDRLLGVTHESAQGLTCHFGVIRRKPAAVEVQT